MGKGWGVELQPSWEGCSFAAVLCSLALSGEGCVQAAASAQDDLDVTSEDFFCGIP